jgi:thioredoxin-related protein
MKIKILVFALLCILLGNQAYSQKVEWKTIEQAAKTDSKSNTKLYFVDFYTSWCGWCKKMDRETFTDPTVALILNKYYIPVKFDAEGNSEFTWRGNKYSNVATAPGNRPSTHSFAKKVLGAKMGFPSFGLFKTDQAQLTVLQGYQSASDLVVILWYFASGDNKRYAFDNYSKIFDKEIRPTMNEKLGIK